jgi:hypothetical protein
MDGMRKKSKSQNRRERDHEISEFSKAAILLASILKYCAQKTMNKGRQFIDYNIFLFRHLVNK